MFFIIKRLDIGNYIVIIMMRNQIEKIILLEILINFLVELADK